MVKAILGICGGISAYKSAYLASLMSKKSYEVKTIMTESAQKFITPLTFKALTKNNVYTDIFENSELKVNHTELSKWADVFIVAPATATTIAKIACGFADNLLNAVVLDFSGPVFLCPAMHSNMWNNKANKDNIEILRRRDIYILGPEKGDLAGGEKGPGRMLEPEAILDEVTDTLKKISFKK
ncbi:MAG: flavoprotein [Atribacterota bacterium]